MARRTPIEHPVTTYQVWTASECLGCVKAKCHIKAASLASRMFGGRWEKLIPVASR